MQLVEVTLHDAITLSYQFDRASIEGKRCAEIVKKISWMYGNSEYSVDFYPTHVVNLGGESPLIDDTTDLIEEGIFSDIRGVHRIIELLPRIESIVRSVLRGNRNSLLIRCDKGDKSAAALAASLSLIGGVPFAWAYSYLLFAWNHSPLNEQAFLTLFQESFEVERRLIELGRMYIEGFSFQDGKRLKTILKSIVEEIEASKQRGPSSVYHPRMHLIISNIYLGNRHYWLDLLNDRTVKEFTPKRIITLCPKCENTLLETLPEHLGIEHIQAPIGDCKEGFDELMSYYWDDIMKAIILSFLEGGILYIHCHEGVSRSPTVLALALALLTGLPFHEIHAFIGSIRPIFPLTEVYPAVYEERAGTTTIAWRAKLYADQEQRN